MHLPTTIRYKQTHDILRHPISAHFVLHGVPLAHHICGCNLESEARLVLIHAFSAQHARLFQFAHHMAKVDDSMAFLQAMGINRRDRSTREYGPVYERQLFGIRVLAFLAS